MFRSAAAHDQQEIVDYIFNQLLEACDYMAIPLNSFNAGYFWGVMCFNKIVINFSQAIANAIIAANRGAKYNLAIH